MTNPQLTELEFLVLKSLSQQDTFDELPTSSIGNLIDETGIEAKQIRGVLTSLHNKGLVQSIVFQNNKLGFQFMTNLYQF